MLSIKPIPEYLAEGDIKVLYSSVKDILNTSSVPLIFQYLASFPSYFSYIWQQALPNLTNPAFRNQTHNIQNFAQKAMDQIYTPSTSTHLFLEKIEGLPVKRELSEFAESAIHLNASLYFFSLAIRESIKGLFLGIKQIGEKLTENEKSVFNDITDGFITFTQTGNDNNNIIVKSPEKINEGMSGPQKKGLTVSYFSEFFKFINIEMEKILKKEAYLTRRVELERFALSLLPFIPHPFESSFATVAKQEAKNPGFPELVYLIADLFPTQAPYKLLSSVVMKKTLSINTGQKEPENTSSPILLLPPSRE